MEKLEAVAIDNQIRLLENSSRVELKLLVPRGNIQKMREATQCRILSKTPEKVNFNHNAGELYRVKISVRWGNISKYFRNGINPNTCINVEAYSQMTGISRHELNWAYAQITDASKIPLYAFGEPKMRNKGGMTNGIYTNFKGHKISLWGKFDKYINFKGTKYALIGTK